MWEQSDIQWTPQHLWRSGTHRRQGSTEHSEGDELVNLTLEVEFTNNLKSDLQVFVTIYKFVTEKDFDVTHTHTTPHLSLSQFVTNRFAFVTLCHKVEKKFDPPLPSSHSLSQIRKTLTPPPHTPPLPSQTHTHTFLSAGITYGSSWGKWDWKSSLSRPLGVKITLSSNVTSNNSSSLQNDVYG
jgi:hypothetical protein